MKIGLRAILLLAAILLFVVAIFADTAKSNWISAGLACFAGAFLLGDLAGAGMGRRLRGRL